MRSGESRYRTGQAEPMEHPGTPLDQSSENCFLQGGVSKQALSWAPSMKTAHLHVHDPSLSIKGGLARQASTSFACMEIPLKAAFGGEQSLCKQCRGWRCCRSAAMIRACENIVPELRY